MNVFIEIDFVYQSFKKIDHFTSINMEQFVFVNVNIDMKYIQVNSKLCRKSRNLQSNIYGMRRSFAFERLRSLLILEKKI